MKRPLIILCNLPYLLLAAFLLAACSLTYSPAASPTHALATITLPEIPEKPDQTLTTDPATSPTVAGAPTAVPEAVTLSLSPADDASSRLVVPDGFAIRIFAQGLTGTPRFMDFGPDGVLYLSLTRAGVIVRLADEDQDGLADGVEVVASGLNLPHGLVWQSDWLYVAQNDRIERLRYVKANNAFDARELVTDNIPGGGGHFTRTVRFGPDGKMYVSAGSSCNVCEESDPRRAAILRFNPDGSIPADNPYAMDPDPRKQPLWAWGLRNAVDFLWTPSGEMWASSHGRDNLLDANGMPDHLPPEVIVFVIQAGGFYGWPYCYAPNLGSNDQAIPQVADYQSGLEPPAGFDCSQAIPALFTDLAHSAPLGMALGKAGNFPAAYQPDLYVAYHGSWNVQDPINIRDCKVERIIVENGRPVRNESFVNGWRTAGQTCASSSSYGRPADIAFGPDGAMYISDDAAGRIYRVIHVP